MEHDKLRNADESMTSIGRPSRWGNSAASPAAATGHRRASIEVNELMSVLHPKDVSVEIRVRK